MTSLDELVRDLAKADMLSARERVQALVTISGLMTRLSLGLAQEPPETPKLLSIKEAAPRLGMKPSTLYKRAHLEPYRSLRVDNGTDRVVFSPEKIAEFIEKGGA